MDNVVKAFGFGKTSYSEALLSILAGSPYSAAMKFHTTNLNLHANKWKKKGITLMVD